MSSSVSSTIVLCELMLDMYVIVPVVWVAKFVTIDVLNDVRKLKNVSVYSSLLCDVVFGDENNGSSDGHPTQLKNDIHSVHVKLISL